MSDPIRGRAAAKDRARERDEERLRRGEISASDLQRENAVFRGVRKDIIGFGPKDRPRTVDYLIIRYAGLIRPERPLARDHRFESSCEDRLTYRNGFAAPRAR